MKFYANLLFLFIFAFVFVESFKNFLSNNFCRFFVTFRRGRIMRFMFAVAAFLLLFGYGNSRVPHGMPEEGGCHKFSGKIFCESGDAILPTATVGLWEADDHDDKFLNGGDDFVVAAPIARDGTFEFEACEWDEFLWWKLESVEFYLEFRNACPNVDYTYADFTLADRFMHYIIPKEGHFIIHSDEFLDLIEEYLPK